jgi:hypothetical protein
MGIGIVYMAGKERLEVRGQIAEVKPSQKSEVGLQK